MTYHSVRRSVEKIKEGVDRATGKGGQIVLEQWPDETFEDVIENYKKEHGAVPDPSAQLVVIHWF